MLSWYLSLTNGSFFFQMSYVYLLYVYKHNTLHTSLPLPARKENYAFYFHFIYILTTTKRRQHQRNNDQKHNAAAASSSQDIATISAIHSFIRPFVRWSFKWKWIWMKTYWEKWAKTECIPPKCSNKYLDGIKTHCKWTLIPELNRRKNKLPLIGFICFVGEGENEETSNCNGHSTFTNGHSEESRKGKKAQPKNISWHFKDLKCMFAAVWEHNRNHNHVEEIVKIESTKLSKTNERNCSNK